MPHGDAPYKGCLDNPSSMQNQITDHVLTCAPAHGEEHGAATDQLGAVQGGGLGEERRLPWLHHRRLVLQYAVIYAGATCAECRA